MFWMLFGGGGGGLPPAPPEPERDLSLDRERLAKQRRELEKRRKGRSDFRIDANPGTATNDQIGGLSL